MASVSSPEDQQLKHRTTAATEQEHKEAQDPTNLKRQKRSAMAKRGLRSLGLAVGLPLSLTLLDIALFGSNIHYATMVKPFWYPPLWAMHSACLVSSSLIGLSAWLVWVEGGFHRNPTALLLCLGAVASGLLWDPIVFRAGANKIGLMVCAAIFGLLVGCMRSFKTINPIAGDLVKPCLLWPLMLSLVNFKLVYH